MIAVGRRTSATPGETSNRENPPDRVGRLPHSLADGALGETLLDLELALTTGDVSWDELTRTGKAPGTLTALIERPVDPAVRPGLFYGVPALLFVLDAAGLDADPRYASTVRRLDQAVERLTRDRLVLARERAATDVEVSPVEFDMFSGLTGLGSLLVRRAPHSRLVHEVVSHVVDLTRDRILGGVRVPGWWTTHAQDRAEPSRGYAELGMVQGAAGLLAFLATAHKAGQTVDDHEDAIGRVVDWLDRWRQEGPDGVWWPRFLTLEELRSGEVRQPGTPSPTWAHGTPGIGRALQMAAIATRDPGGRKSAEDAIASCLTPRLLDRMIEPGLYTGTAGLYQTVFRAAQDAQTSTLGHRPATAADAFTRTGREWPEDPALLTGRAGTRLVNQTLRRGAVASVTGWDRFLQISWAHA